MTLTRLLCGALALVALAGVASAKSLYSLTSGGVDIPMLWTPSDRFIVYPDLVRATLSPGQSDSSVALAWDYHGRLSVYGASGCVVEVMAVMPVETRASRSYVALRVEVGADSVFIPTPPVPRLSVKVTNASGGTRSVLIGGCSW